MPSTTRKTAKKTAKHPAPAGAGVASAEGAVTHNTRGKWTRHEGQLTERQAKFVYLYVSNGGDKKSAVKGAGYSTAYPGQVASQMLALPHIQKALRHEREKFIGSSLAGVALNTMLGLMNDKDTPAATRFQAAKWSLETAGHGKDNGKDPSLPDPDKPLSSMSLSELEAFISAGQSALSRPVIDATAEASPGDQEYADYTEVDKDEAQDSARIEDMMRVSD